MSRYFDTPNERGETVHCWRAEKQVYALNDCMFSAGIVEGNDPDTIYLRLEKQGVEPTTIFMRPDEASAIIRCLAGAIWSLQMGELSGNSGELKALRDKVTALETELQPWRDVSLIIHKHFIDGINLVVTPTLP